MNLTNKYNTDRLDEIQAEMDTYNTVIVMLASLKHIYELNSKYNEAMIKNAYDSGDKVNIIISTLRRDLKLYVINEIERMKKIYEERLQQQQSYFDNAKHPNKKQKTNHECSMGLCKCSCDV